MSAPIPSLAPSSRTTPPLLLWRLAALIVRTGWLALQFRPAHRLLPARVRIGSSGVRLCAAMFFAAAWLRHALVGGHPPERVLAAAALAFGVLLLVSLRGRALELVLCLCISVATDLLVAGLALAGLTDLDGETARSLLAGWQLMAVFVALVRLRLGRMGPLPSA